MTDLATPSTDAVLSAAERAAEAAAAASDVEIRSVGDLDGLAGIARLFATIWGREQGPPMSPELLRAMSKAGSYIVGAFRDGMLVGACVGFHEEPALQTLHSHIAGVAPGPWRHVGFALKLHQRAWALRRGITEIAWTYDPLVALNAYFNIAKLGAEPVEYLSNFYGNMADAINGYDETDRLLTRWRLTDPSVEAACSGSAPRRSADEERAHGAAVLLSTGRDGLPVRGSAGSASTLLIAVPGDISRMRSEHTDAARQWRIAVREALAPLLEEGARIVGFDRAGWYVVQRASGGATTDAAAPAAAD